MSSAQLVSSARTLSSCVQPTGVNPADLCRDAAHDATELGSGGRGRPERRVVKRKPILLPSAQNQENEKFFRIQGIRLGRRTHNT